MRMSWHPPGHPQRSFYPRFAVSSVVRFVFRPRILRACPRILYPSNCTHMATPKTRTSGASGAAVMETSAPSNGSNPEREHVFEAFRRWGYLEGDLDPLGFLRPRPHPDLQIDNEYPREARP